MPNERITQLFTQLDPTLKAVVLDVLTLEQQNISYKSVPRIKEQLDEIITRAAKRVLTEPEMAGGSNGDENDIEVDAAAETATAETTATQGIGGDAQ